MKNQQTVVSGVIAIAFVGLIALIAWIWLRTPDAGESTSVSVPNTIDPGPTPPEPPAVDPVLAQLRPAAEHWSGISQQDLDPPEPPLAGNEIVCPSLETLTIARDDPDKTSPGYMSTRVDEMSGLMSFDISALKEPPTKAVLRLCVSGIENVGGYHTPVCIVLYRVKVEWDDSATWQHTKSRDRVAWPAGHFAISDANVDPMPVAMITVPSPPPRGFNLQADITPLVAGWVTKKYPNYGLAVSNAGTKGLSYQGWIPGRKFTTGHYPQIVCTVPAPKQP